MGLARSEREQFLAEPHVAALSVVAGPERGPLSVPIWYQYAPGEDAWILTPAESRKARLIEAAGRFTLLVDRVRPTVRYVSVEGPVAGIEPGTDQHHWELARRYLPAEKARAYAELAIAEFGPQKVVHLRPERWLSADLGPADSRTSDRLLQDAVQVDGDAEALVAEQWASAWLGSAWVAMGEREPERSLCTEVVGRASARPSPRAFAAVAALLRVAPESERAMLEESVQILGATQPAPSWIDAPRANPVAGWRAVDVWDSARVLFVEFDVPQPHTLAAWIMTSGGTYVTMLGVLGPRAVTTWAKDLDHPTPMPVAEQPADEVLAEIAGALRRTDMTWPRNDEHDFVRWRALAWSRCREHLPEFPEWEPLTDDERAQLIDDFIAAGAPDNDVTRSVADLFLDYGDGYIESGTCTGARPRFALTRRALEPQWIEPVVAAVDEHVAEFTNAFDDESAWGPAKEVVAELQARGVDPADREAMEDGLRALNAERLARRLLEE